MKHLNRFLAAFVLMCALTVSASAGDIHCGRTSEPPVNTGEATASELCGEISCGVTRAAFTLILSLL